jgi:hypothetical protein
MTTARGANVDGVVESPEKIVSGVGSVKTANDYYRPAVLLPKELKERVTERAADLGISVSSYITNLIEADLGAMIDKAEYGHGGKGRRKSGDNS